MEDTSNKKNEEEIKQNKELNAELKIKNKKIETLEENNEKTLDELNKIKNDNNNLIKENNAKVKEISFLNNNKKDINIEIKNIKEKV